MFWLDNPSGVPQKPAEKPVHSTTRLYFTEGGSGQAPSYPGEEWFNMVQEELLNVVAEANLTPSKADRTQLAKAIKAIIAAKVATTTDVGVVRKATDEEAKLGQAIGAMMDAKNVSDFVKQILVGVPIPWMSATPPAWALNMSGQAINASTDPLLAARYPSGYLDDMRAMTIKGFDNGRGLDPNRQMLSFQPGSLAYGDDDWSNNAMFLSGMNQGNRAASSYGVPVAANYPNAKSGGVSTATSSGNTVNFNAAGVTQVDNKAYNYITMRG